MTTIIGLDHGNGWVKAVTSNNSIVLPSAIARKEALGEGFTTQETKVREYESTSEKGSVYLWGSDINKASKLLPTYGSQDRYIQSLYKLLCEFAIAEVLKGDSFEDVWIVTGVPTEEKGTVVEDQIKKVLLGGHIVKVDGVEKMIKVTNVIILPQPVGTIMNLYLDQEGFVLDDSYETSSVGIIDIGTGTTDLDHINELRRQEDDSLSITIGMIDVYKKIAAYIKKQKPSVNVTAQDVEEQFNQDDYEISSRSHVSIKEIKERTLRETAQDIKSAITQQWKTWDRFDEIVITGGGASTLGKILKELINDARTVNNSQTANAEGFYKYGVYLKGE